MPALPVLLFAAWRRTTTLLECRDPVASPSSRRCEGARPLAQSPSPNFRIACLGQASCFFCVFARDTGHGQQGGAATLLFGDGIDKARCHDIGHVVSDDIPCFCHDKSLGRRETYTPSSGCRSSQPARRLCMSSSSTRLNPARHSLFKSILQPLQHPHREQDLGPQLHEISSLACLKASLGKGTAFPRSHRDSNATPI